MIPLPPAPPENSLSPPPHSPTSIPPQSHPMPRAPEGARRFRRLPFLQKLDAIGLERFRFAALKVCGGRMDRLRDAVELAKRDWRDLLMAAGFGNSIHAHEQWMPQRQG